MKKSIFLFFAAILCAMTANAVDYYYRGQRVNNWGAGQKLEVSTDGYYSYIYFAAGSEHEFKICEAADDWSKTAYGKTYNSVGFNGTDVTELGDNWGGENCKIWSSKAHYVLVYHPNTAINTTNKPIICASTFLPDDRECYLMGVDGDWTTGINMTLNPKNNNEFILLDQPIKDPIKFKVKGNTEKWTDEVENYNKNGESWVDGNLVLPEGNYDFYFKKDIMKVYIARNTVVTTTANPAEGGTLTGAGVYNNDDDVTLTATPNTGYNFVNWTKGGTQVSTDATYAFKAAGDVEYVANFVKVVDVTLSGMVATPYSRMGSYRFLSLDDEDGNQISIFNGTEGAYGNDFEVNAYLAAYDVTVVGTGDWNVVDGVETLTATLQVEDDNTTIYNVTATVGVATTITLECWDATYTITDPEYNEVTFTGVADGKEFTILVSYFGGEYYSEGEWGETLILGTEVEFDDTDAEAYYLGGTYVDDANNTYEVAIFGAPAVVEPTSDYTRTTTAGKFGTICLPFGSTNYTGMELFECVGQETGKVYIASVTTLEAGVPYIFLATGTELAVYSDGTTAATPGDHNGLHGTFTDDTEVAVGNYILKDNALCQAATTCYVNANRAYLVMGEVPAGAPQQMPGRKYIGMSTKGENATTGLDNITNGENVVKTIVNGQLVITIEGVQYNAQGVRF